MIKAIPLFQSRIIRGNRNIGQADQRQDQACSQSWNRVWVGAWRTRGDGGGQTNHQILRTGRISYQYW